MSVLQIIFILIAAVTLFSATMVVIVRKMMHAALWLVLALFGVAMIFATLQASYFAVIQVLVYIGAIAILIIFSIMLTQRVLETAGEQLVRNWWLPALVALAQKDLKRLVAYSSVAHLGFVMLGIATLTDIGLNAAIFGMVAHGLITGMLFFCAGSVKDRYHTLEIKRLGGMLIQAPHMGWLLGSSAMASLGLPGLAGFWGEFPAILSAYNPADGLSEELFRFYMVVAAIGTVLAAGYLLWLLQRVAFGTPTEEFEHEHIHDMHLTDYLAWAPMILFIVVLGVYPNLIFRVTDAAVIHSLAGLGGN